jgi:hypothetical protein
LCGSKLYDRTFRNTFPEGSNMLVQDTRREVRTLFIGRFWGQLLSPARQCYWTITLSAPWSDGGFESQATSDVKAMYVLGAAFKAIGPDLARAPASTSEQLLSANGLPSDLKCTERGLEEELDQRIHSWFALIRVQSDSFPAAMSIVHFAVRTGGRSVEPAGLATDVQNTNIDPKHAIESTTA